MKWRLHSSFPNAMLSLKEANLATKGVRKFHSRSDQKVAGMNDSLEYEIDITLMKVLAQAKITEARECLHCALVMQAHGFPRQAAYEKMLKRKYMQHARIAQSVYK